MAFNEEMFLKISMSRSMCAQYAIRITHFRKGCKMKKIILLVLVLALALTTEVAEADFVFGTPTNLGPNVNTASGEGGWVGLSISTDELSIYFDDNRSGGYGSADLWVSTRVTKNDEWGEPVNLGPLVNSSNSDSGPSISGDGLSLFFTSQRPGAVGGNDLWVATRETTVDDWGAPSNLGPVVNSSDGDYMSYISVDGLSLYFSSYRSGGLGKRDLWVSTRTSTDDEWGEPVNLGPTINTEFNERRMWISSDGLMLMFQSDRPRGTGYVEIYMTTRTTTNDDWAEPVKLGPPVNLTSDISPIVSSDGRTLYFSSYNRDGGYGVWDLWQAPIDPIVDFNGDGQVGCIDLCAMVDHWGTDEQLYDIGPMPWGDGIVDVQDLIVLAEHLFEGIPPVEPEEVNVDEKDDGSQVELEQGQILVVTLESNPTTGYSWQVVEAQGSILEQMGEAEFKQSDTGEPPLVGAGGWEIFRFKAISAGQMTLKLAYRRPWEEGVEPLKTFSIQVAVN